MENYEKKYKEALEWARKVMQGEIGFVLDEVLEKFPELTESGDERVRKALITFFQRFPPYERIDNAGTIVKEAIAWLEKQGEQNPAWSISDFRTWQYIVSDVLTKKDGIGQHLDSDECKKIAKYMQEEWGKRLSIEKKPAEWSEEDERVLKDTIRFCELCGNQVSANWLESLRPQNTWKPSEEMLEALYRAVPQNVKEMSEDEILLDKLYQGLRYGEILSK